jgi:hypothetical protein
MPDQHPLFDAYDLAVVTLESLQAAARHDRANLRAKLGRRLRLGFPANIEPDLDLMRALRETCLATLEDDHDAEQALALFVREGVRTEDDAIEALVDWTARRERSRLGRMRQLRASKLSSA